MKYISFCLFILGLLISASACGQNLVPNPSFEEYLECPNGEYDIDLAFPWTSYDHTPDYFNACDETNGAGVPYSAIYGYQYPYHGVGQAGFIAIGFQNIHEVIGAELISPMEVGEDYFVSFYTNRGFGGGAHSNCDCAVNNIGMKFINREYSVTDPISIDNQADVYSTEVIIDTLEWTLVSGWFNSDSAYSHIALGNFFDANNNDIVNYNDYPFYNTYYFIDAVCVSKNPADCNDFTSSVEGVQFELNTLELYPNPVIDNLVVKTDKKELVQFQIYDITGRLIINRRINSLVIYTCNVSQLLSGMYIAKLILKDGSIISKNFCKSE